MKTFISINTLRNEFNSTCFSNIFRRTEFTVKNKNIKKISDKKFKQVLMDFLEKEKLSCPGCKLSFNNIQLLRKYGVIDKYCLKDSNNKNKAYLQLINDKKIYIRNQDQFTFIFIDQLYKQLQKLDKQDIIDDFFYISDNYLYVRENKIMIEKTEKTSGNNLRTDLSFIVNNYKIVVEYLENHHDHDILIHNQQDYVRGLLLLNDTNNISHKIVCISYFWQKDLLNTKTKTFSFETEKFVNFVDYMCGVIIDYYLISDKDTYCINKLTEITGNKSLSEQLYTAHNNKNKPIVKLSILEKIFNWANPESKKMWYTEFSDRIQQIKCEKNKIKQLEKNNMSLFDSDSEDEKDENTEEEIIYYEKINDSIYLTDYGLHHYINMPPNYLTNILEYDKNILYFHSISAGLISSIEEIRQLKDKLESNKIYGLKK